MKRAISLLLLVLMIIAGLSGQEVRAALTGLENLNRETRYDYLGGLVQGILLYDLSRAPDVTLVERSRIDLVLEEQNLQLSGLIEDEQAVEAGRLMGATHLIQGGYVFLGEEVVINLTVVDVETGTGQTISRRSRWEEDVHILAEETVLVLTGARPRFATGEATRSLLSLEDEEPGSLLLYCNFQDGEIYVDGEFSGYTPGGREPTLIESLSPGEHTLRIYGGPNFGVVDLPAYVFRDWEETVVIQSGRQRILRATIRHFNDVLYNGRRLVRETLELTPGETDAFRETWDLTYTDREGRRIQAALNVEGRLLEDVASAKVDLTVGNEQVEIELSEPEQEEEGVLGPVQYSFKLAEPDYWGEVDVSVEVERTDIYQGLHREEGKAPPNTP